MLSNIPFSGSEHTPKNITTNVSNIFVERVEFAVRGSGTVGMNAVITSYGTPSILTFPANWNASTGTYTISTLGQYRISFRVPFSTTTNSRGNDIYLYLNGSIFAYWTFITSTAPPGSPEYYTGSIDLIDTFAANDTINFGGADSAGTFVLSQLWWNITRIS